MWGFAGCQLCVALDRNGDWVFSEKNGTIFLIAYAFNSFYSPYACMCTAGNCSRRLHDGWP